MIINIIDSEHKVTKAGVPFMRFATSQGWMSCFDKPTYEAVNKCVNGSADVEVSQSGNYKNIAKFLKAVTGEEGAVAVNVKTNGQSAMYVSYAKDIFCAMLPEAVKKEIAGPEVMEMSIDLVKQAMAEFSS